MELCRVKLLALVMLHLCANEMVQIKLLFFFNVDCDETPVCFS